MSLPEKDVETAAVDLENFEFHVFDLYSGVERELRESMFLIAEKLKKPQLRGPLFAMTHELTVNALKALYKRVFYSNFVEEIGLDYVGYEDWLKLFKVELEEHQAENFAHVCRTHNMFVTVKGVFLGDVFRIQVENAGVPTETEFGRLTRSIERAKSGDVNPYLFMDDDEDLEKEGGGIGLMLIITSLLNLAISPDNFKITSSGDQTTACIDLPIHRLLAI